MRDIRMFYIDDYFSKNEEENNADGLFSFAVGDYIGMCATPINFKTNFVVGGVVEITPVTEYNKKPDYNRTDLENFLKLVVAAKAAIVVIDFHDLDWQYLTSIRELITKTLEPYGFRDLKSYDYTSKIAMGNFRWSNINR